MEFIVGCNYWASNAGTNMWKDFDINVIEKDIKTLKEHGMDYMRVFPNWRDFQPVVSRYSSPNAFVRYATEDDELNENGYYLDKNMMERFSSFLDICEKYNVKLIVGLITGFMSGALLIPPALQGENPVSSPLAQYFEQLFIKGFVSEFKNREIIYAWDLGNECNMFYSNAPKYTAASWIGLMANTIRSADPTRPVISGMAAVDVVGAWSIQDQAMFCDMTTTHPYPFWGKHTRIDETLSIRTTMHPTCQTKLFADIGKKPCLCEETGTMGPMVASDKNAGDFIRLNAFSLWANSSTGVMWWCGHDQTKLEHFPYTDAMVERELGLLKNDFTPKPALLELDKFSKWLKTLDFELPKAKDDAVCVLTRNQDQWGVAYMTYILSRIAGINCGFAYADDGIPQSDIYMLPSLANVKVMHKKRFDDLLKRVFDGADLYISIENAMLSEFESFSGLRVIDSYEHQENVTAEVLGKEIETTKYRNYIVEPTTAEVLAYDNNGNPFITKNHYGKGRVFFVNAAIEKNLLNKHHAFENNIHLIYQKVFEDCINNYPVKVSDKDLVLTYHPADDGAYVVILNHYNEKKEFTLELDGYTVDKVYYGENGKIKPFDACVIKIKKR